MSKLRILFTGGGTGGHIYPIVAVAQQLNLWCSKSGLVPDLRYFGAPGDYRAALKSAGIKVSRILSSKWRRYFSLLNFLDILKFGLSVFQALWKIYWFMPEVAFSKGGPGSLPVVLVCAFYRIPIIIHESDSVPGMANKLGAKFAKAVELAFSSAAKHFPKVKNLNVVGNPSRSEILVDISPADLAAGASAQEAAKSAFGLDSRRALILVFGGSQGSNRMNDFIIGNLEILLSKFQILHIVGKEKFADYKNQFEFTTKNFSPVLLGGYKYFDFLEDRIGQALKAADVVMARGGSGAIFDVAAAGKPAVIIPFPEASADHQKENAYEYAATGAAVVIEQENLFLSIFLNEVEKILGTSDIASKMSAAALNFAKPDSAEKISVDILGLIH